MDDASSARKDRAELLVQVVEDVEVGEVALRRPSDVAALAPLTDVDQSERFAVAAPSFLARGTDVDLDLKVSDQSEPRRPDLYQCRNYVHAHLR